MGYITKTFKKTNIKIRFVDLFFLSFGGQSPFLSVLTYGVSTFILAGSFGSFAIILGTLLVAIDGLVVTSLAKRFTETGGYYIYTLYSLKKGIGFMTGWLYILFSNLYGVAYVLGSSYILYDAFHLNFYIGALLVYIPAVIFAILGIRPTLRYAIGAAILEVSALISIVFFFLYLSNFTFYNPINTNLNIYNIALVVLLASSIPIGYDSITPLGGESERPKVTISKAIFSVIIFGGILAAFNIYSISNYIIFNQVPIKSASIINVILNKFGNLAALFIIFAAANDGILATLSFILSASRTLFAMANHNSLPEYFKKFDMNKGPMNALIFTSIVYFIILILSLYIFNDPFIAFLHIAIISLISYYFVHLFANFALFRITIAKISKRFLELLLSIIAIVITLVELIFVFPIAPINSIVIFIAWTIIGIIYLLKNYKIRIKK